MSTYVGHNISRVDYCSKHKLTLISRTVVFNLCGGQGDTIINQQLSFLSTVIVRVKPLKGRVPCLKHRLEKSHQLELFSPAFAQQARVYQYSLCVLHCLLHCICL